MFFTSACWGLGDNGTLAMTLIEKGMEAYAGANGPVNILYANEILSQTAKNLVQEGGRRNLYGSGNRAESGSGEI